MICFESVIDRGGSTLEANQLSARPKAQLAAVLYAPLILLKLIWLSYLHGFNRLHPEKFSSFTDATANLTTNAAPASAAIFLEGGESDSGCRQTEPRPPPSQAGVKERTVPHWSTVTCSQQMTEL